MKKVLRKIYLVFKGIGYARYAAHYARQGDRKKAIEIMQEYERCR